MPTFLAGQSVRETVTGKRRDEERAKRRLPTAERWYFKHQGKTIKPLDKEYNLSDINILYFICFFKYKNTTVFTVQ